MNDAYCFCFSRSIVGPCSSPSQPQPWRSIWLKETMGPLPVYSTTLLFPLLSLLLLCYPCISLRSQVIEREFSPEQTQSSNNTTVFEKKKCADVVVCQPGILLPVWLPLNPPLGEQAGRAIIYFLCLMYMFLGVSIIADRFMASIEVITSQVLLWLMVTLDISLVICVYLFFHGIIVCFRVLL